MPSEPGDPTTPTPSGTPASGPSRSASAPDRGPEAVEDLLVPFGAPPAAPTGGGGEAPPGEASTSSGEGGRGRRRRARSALRPLWWSMPVVIVLALASTFLVGLHVWSWAGVRAYQDDGFDRARSGFEGQLGWTRSGPEAWVADYNLGSTLLVQGYLDVGVAHLERAMEKVPRATEVAPGYIEAYSYECRVRTNLALGLEGQGDVQAGDLQWAQAADLYERSADLLSPCRSFDSSQAQSGAQSGDPQSGQGGGGQSGDGDGGQSGGTQSGDGSGGQSGDSGDGSGGQGGGSQSGGGAGGSGSEAGESGGQEGDEGGTDGAPSPGPSPSGGQPSSQPSAQPSSQPSGQTGGQQTDPGEEAEDARDRLEGKARDARERADGRAPSTPSTDPSGPPSPGPGAGGEPTPGSEGSPSPSQGPSGEDGTTPGSSPTPDPFGNETDQERERREELERRLENSRNDQDRTFDKNRPGTPNGGW